MSHPGLCHLAPHLTASNKKFISLIEGDRGREDRDDRDDRDNRERRENRDEWNKW
jgi:hypothetical protein